MQVSVSVRHGQLNHFIQEQIQTKLQRLTRFSDRITEIDDVIVEANSMISAAGKVQHKLEQQLRKYKQKRTDHRLPALKQVAWSSPTDE